MARRGVIFVPKHGMCDNRWHHDSVHVHGIDAEYNVEVPCVMGDDVSIERLGKEPKGHVTLPTCGEGKPERKERNVMPKMNVRNTAAPKDITTAGLRALVVQPAGATAMLGTGPVGAATMQ